MKASTKTQKPKLPAKIAKPAASKRRPSQLTRPTRRSLFAPRKRTVLIILIICFATILASALYARHQADLNSQTKQDQAYEDDKDQFTKVEAEMQTAYDAMIAAAGTPDKSNQSKSCSHVSLKFEEGTLRCSISYDFSYDVENKNEARGITSAVLDSLQESVFKVEVGSQSAEDLKLSSGAQDIIVSLQARYGMSCRINTYYKVAQTSTEKNSIDYNFFCSAVPSSKQEIYPLAQ